MLLHFSFKIIKITICKLINFEQTMFLMLQLPKCVWVNIKNW